MSTVLITGGHSGIGLAAAHRLASRGVDLVLAGRSPERIRDVAEELRSEGGSVTALDVDTSSLASVRHAAAELGARQGDGRLPALDAVLLNAGGRFDGPVSYSPDGYETTFATNCLGNFLLTQLLLPLLSERGRVVFTASGTHDPDTRDGRLVGPAVEPDAVALADDGKDGRGALPAGKRYATSKLCTVMYAYELDRRLRRSGSPVLSIAFDPGSVPGTGFLRAMPAPVRILSTTRLMKWFSRRMGVTTSDLPFSGASLADLAVDGAYADASGGYYQANDGRFRAVRSSRMSYDEARAAKLWDDSRRLVGLTDDEEPEQLR
jgi:NAD(P)-dependent dehydrogenase (short-subunit alcohol dehydrogenase family)